MANDFDNLFDGVASDVHAAAIDGLAEEIANVARENGMTSTANIEIDASELQGFDVDAIRRRADEMLAADR